MPPSCYEKAVRLLAARPHFQRELQAKLFQRGYPAGEIEAALARLREQGYLDDAAAARGFVESRLSRGAEGRARLRVELERRGAPEPAIAAALSALTPDDDLPAARAAAAEWERRGGHDPKALARHLDRKGFSRRAIVAVLQDRPDGLDSDDES